MKVHQLITVGAVTLSACGGAAWADILVYDNDTFHSLAQTAAFNLDPGGTVVATAANFNALLVSQAWDVVAVDVPNFGPDGGWGDLINYVNGGGAAVMAFWDWDNSSGQGDPNLPAAFGVSISSSISLNGQTLFDSGNSGVFAGVTMPKNGWHGHWGDDGDQFNLSAVSVGLAHIGAPATPVMVLGNNARTIAAPVFDEAGDTWLGDGSGIQLWENMLTLVPPVACPWDLNGSGDVGVLDLLVLLVNWGPCPTACPPQGPYCGFDDDCIIGILDLLILLANWGPCP